jgi:type I restriction enzyme S subunit
VERLRDPLLSQRQNLIRQSTGGAQPNISQKTVRELLVPVPPLPEQRRIVDLLSRAEGIVRLRREAEEKAAELIPALFLDMFGDPASNPKGWPVRKVSDFVARFEGGKNIQAGSANGSRYRILKVSAVTSGVYRESESKPSPDDYSPPTSHIVRAGDMLFSRANTEKLVGATAIVESTDGQTLLPDKLWRFVWNEPLESAYMHALFQSAHVRRELGKLSSGTSASMRNIAQAKLYGLSLPIAPHAIQKEFTERWAMLASIRSQQTAATAKAQAAFDAQLAKCFDQGA